jgi:hypothetical protein
MTDQQISGVWNETKIYVVEYKVDHGWNQLRV